MVAIRVIPSANGSLSYIVVYSLDNVSTIQSPELPGRIHLN